MAVVVIATLAAALAWSADAALGAGPDRDQPYSTNRPGPHNDWGDLAPNERQMWMPGAPSPNAGEDRWTSPDEIE